jgi:diguanylate cyclase (GGDEF)-like protein/PAS domain S-box-containing protein
MASDRPRTGLRRFLYGSFLWAALVPLAVLALAQAWLSTRDAERRAQLRLREQAVGVERRIANYLAEHRRMIELFAYTFEREGVMVESDVTREVLAGFNAHTPGIRTMIVVDRDGWIIAADPAVMGDGVDVVEAGVSGADRTYFQVPMATGDSYVSDVFMGRGYSSEPIVAVSAPLHDPDGTLAGVAEGSLVLASLESIEADYRTFEGAEMLVLDGSGQVVYASPSLPLAALDTLDSANPLAGFRTPGHLLETRRIEPLGWQVAVRLPVALVHQAGRRALLLAGLWALAAVALALLLIWRRSDRAARPMARLAEAVHAYQRTGPGERTDSELTHVIVDPDAPAEVAALADGFWELTQSLDRTFEELQSSLRIQQSLNRELEEVAFYLEEIVQVRTSELEANEKRYRQLVEWSSGMIAAYELDGTVRSMNPAALESLDRQLAEVQGQPIQSFLTPESREDFSTALARLDADGAVEGLMRIDRSDGEPRVWFYRNRLVQEDGHAPYVLGHALDLTERHRSEELLARRALEDPVTGLANRASIEDRLRLGLDQAERRGNSLGALMLDLDQFKEINDTWGHAAGDQVLREIAERIERTVRKSDTAGRWGGDEFVILLPDLDSSTAAERVASKVLAAFEEPVVVDVSGRGEMQALEVRTSLGIGLFPEHASEPTELLQVADRAMYRAKARGRASGHSELAMGRPLTGRIDSGDMPFQTPPPFEPPATEPETR